MTIRCEACGALFDKKPTGRPAKYCASCRKQMQDDYKAKIAGPHRKQVNVDKPTAYENR